MLKFIEELQLNVSNNTIMKKFFQNFEQFINFKNPFLWLSALHIIFNVLLWNVTSRIQYKTKFFSNLFGDKKRAVYIHTIIIFSFGLSRDFLYKYVVNTSNFFPLIDNQYMTYIGYMILFSFCLLLLQVSLLIYLTRLCIQEVP